METRSNQVLVGVVVLALLALLALFTVWMARLSAGNDKDYDIFFKQSVAGLDRGASVAFSGVPSGQVRDIQLWPRDPNFVRVRIVVRDETPVLEGTTATISSSFTGTSTVQLDGAVRGAAPIRCPDINPQESCPFGVPVIPPRQGGFGALLSSAPQLLQRLSSLTGRLNDLLSDKNQESVAGILKNTNRLTRQLADHVPNLDPVLADTRSTLQKAANAADQITALVGSANGLLTDDVRPATQQLSKAIASAQQSLDTLNSTLNDARPGLQTFSKQTIPQANQLVLDLRTMAQSLTSVAEKLDTGGAASLLGPAKLPDYKPKK